MALAAWPSSTNTLTINKYTKNNRETITLWQYSPNNTWTLSKYSLNTDLKIQMRTTSKS